MERQAPWANRLVASDRPTVTTALRSPRKKEEKKKRSHSDNITTHEVNDRQILQCSKHQHHRDEDNRVTRQPVKKRLRSYIFFTVVSGQLREQLGLFVETDKKQEIENELLGVVKKQV